MGNLVGSITVDFTTETSIVVRGDGRAGFDRVAVGDANLWPCYTRHQAATDTEIIAACAALIVALEEVQERSRQRMAAEWAAAGPFEDAITASKAEEDRVAS